MSVLNKHIYIRKFNSSSRYFSEHNFFALDTNPLQMSLTYDGLTNEYGFTRAFVIAFSRCILNWYFPVPVFIMVTSKKFSFCDWSSFSNVYCIASFSLFKIFKKPWDWCTASNLAWLSSTYLLPGNGAKFIVRASCIALSSKRWRETSDITTVNSKPIGRGFSRLPKIE